MSHQCDICDNGEAVKTCKDCELNFCHCCCNKFHKNGILRNHVFSNISNTDSLNLEIVTCENHFNREATALCNECTSRLCQECVVEHPATSGKHCGDNNITCLKEVIAIKMREIEVYKDTLLQSIENLEKAEILIQEFLDKGNSQYDKAKQNIEEQDKTFNDSLNNIAESMRKKAESQWDSMKKDLQSQIVYTSSCKDRMTEQIKNLDRTFDLTSLLAIKLLKISDFYEPAEVLRQKVLSQYTFITNSSMLQKERDFGIVTKGPHINIQRKIWCGLSFVTNIFVLRSKFILLANSEEGILIKVRLGRDRLEEERQFKGYKVCDIAETSEDDVILSCKDTGLQILRQDGKVENFRSFAPRQTFGLCVNNDNEIIVLVCKSMREGEFSMTVEDVALYVLNNSGETLRTLTLHSDDVYRYYSFDPNQCANKVRCDKDNNIYILSARKIKAITKTGELRWEYKGESNDKKNDRRTFNSFKSDFPIEFHPTDIVLTSSGFLLVSNSPDSSGPRIYVLNTDGEVFRCIKFDIVADRYVNYSYINLGHLEYDRLVVSEYNRTRHHCYLKVVDIV